MGFQDEWAKLTDVQRQAVEHIDGPMLVLAGPGSGKTRVVTHRIANLIRHGVHPSSILAMTFTNKAADEMKERVERLAPGNPVWIGTFHRFCSRLLRRYASYVGLDANFTIYDTDDSRRALKQAIEPLKLPLTLTTPDRLAHQISSLKNRLISADNYEPRYGSDLGPILADVYPAYQKRLLEANAVDFDDLLMHVAKMLQLNPELRALLDERYAYILVDEYQDTNVAQYAIVRGLSIDHPNLAVTGDPDQSIYGWRGATLKNILNFEHDYPSVRVVRLEQNYRSTPNILSVADALIRNNRHRKHKELFTDNPPGAPVRLVTYPSGADEAKEIVQQIVQQTRLHGRRLSDIAIFFRTNALSRTIEYSLRDAGLPYQIVNGLEFYQRKEVKDVLAYLHVIHNPRNDVALARIINVPPRRIGATSLKRLMEFAYDQGLSLLEAARLADRITSLGKPARQAIRAFATLMDRLSEPTSRVLDQMRRVVDETGYLDDLKQSQLPEDVDRVANVEELLSAADEFDDRYEEGDVLSAFLEHVALVSDVDAWERTDKVTLMTLHAAKGLEFPVVYIVAVEQGILPHERSTQSDDQLEEERRLLFVGITRAKEELQLSWAETRNHQGGVRRCVPSMFLLELPRGEMEQNRSLYGLGIDDEDSSMSDYCFDELPDDDVCDVDSNDHDFEHVQDNANESTGHEHSEAADDLYAQEMHEHFCEDPDDLTRRPNHLAAKKANVRTFRTASEMLPAHADEAELGDQPARPAPRPLEPSGVDPATFRVGMTVVHPEYGPGKVMELSGSGKSRVGKINFATVGAKTFVLAMSPVRPVASKG